jgi:hypothetical protein
VPDGPEQLGDAEGRVRAQSEKVRLICVGGLEAGDARFGSVKLRFDRFVEATAGADIAGRLGTQLLDVLAQTADRGVETLVFGCQLVDVVQQCGRDVHCLVGVGPGLDLGRA